MSERRYEPLVSIVIPVYNGANYVAEAIESALAQTYQNIEIIVVNDGSTDDGATEETVLQYAGRVRYIKKENGGSSSALNCGIRNMRGEWFSWLSHDDLYDPKKVQTQIDFLAQVGEQENVYRHIFFSGADLINGEGDMIRQGNAKSMRNAGLEIDSIKGNEYLVAEPTKYNFNGCSCLIHKKAFEEVGEFDESLRLVNDVDMWYRLYIAGFKVHYVPKALVKGRIHAKQISRSIGFSYHNPEQDWFWGRSFQWLMENHPKNYRLFFLYGRNAYLKTRTEDGDKAFAAAISIRPNAKVGLYVKKYIYKGCAVVRTAGKKVYLTLKV